MHCRHMGKASCFPTVLEWRIHHHRKPGLVKYGVRKITLDGRPYWFRSSLVILYLIAKSKFGADYQGIRIGVCIALSMMLGTRQSLALSARRGMV
jgi:hypothetical protein